MHSHSIKLPAHNRCSPRWCMPILMVGSYAGCTFSQPTLTLLIDRVHGLADSGLSEGQR